MIGSWIENISNERILSFLKCVYAIIVVFCIVLWWIASLQPLEVFVFSGSMAPTIPQFDTVLVDQYAYDTSPPLRWDVAAFQSENGPFIEVFRIVGLPGEIIKIQSNTIWINGTPIPLPEYLPDSYRSNLAQHQNFGDISSRLEPAALSETSLYILGDHLLDSIDSRFWGTMNRERLVGKVILEPENR